MQVKLSGSNNLPSIVESVGRELRHRGSLTTGHGMRELGHFLLTQENISKILHKLLKQSLSQMDDCSYSSAPNFRSKATRT